MEWFVKLDPVIQFFMVVGVVSFLIAAVHAIRPPPEQ
jgi:hypothetical protein